VAARATQARGDGDGDEGEDDGGLLGGGLRAMREHPAAFAASAALGVGVNYLSFLVIEARGAAPPPWDCRKSQPPPDAERVTQKSYPNESRRTRTLAR